MSVDQTIVFWNRGAQRILGYQPDEVLGRKCYDVTSGLVPGGFTAECREGCPSIRYLRSGLIPAPVRLHMRCASGERKWVTVMPMVISGILRDAPLLVHLFDDRIDPEQTDQVTGPVRDALMAAGADVVSDHPEAPAVAEDRPALTPRELEVLQLMALSWETSRIGEELGISKYTVRNHISNLRRKLNANNKLDAVITGIRMGIVPIG